MQPRGPTALSMGREVRSSGRLADSMLLSGGTPLTSTRPCPSRRARGGVESAARDPISTHTRPPSTSRILYIRHYRRLACLTNIASTSPGCPIRHRGGGYGLLVSTSIRTCRTTHLRIRCIPPQGRFHRRATYCATPPFGHVCTRSAGIAAPDPLIGAGPAVTSRPSASSEVSACVCLSPWRLLTVCRQAPPLHLLLLPAVPAQEHWTIIRYLPYALVSRLIFLVNSC